jgi:hypothetical protein
MKHYLHRDMYMPPLPNKMQKDSSGCQTQAARASPRSFNHQHPTIPFPSRMHHHNLDNPSLPHLHCSFFQQIPKNNILHTASNPVNNTVPHDPLFPASEADIPPCLGTQTSHIWCVRVVSGTHMLIATMILEWKWAMQCGGVTGGDASELYGRW